MAVEVTVTDTAVHIRVTGWDRVWSLSSGRSIPMADIVSASVVPRRDVMRRLALRAAGTHLPWVTAAGHFLLRRGPDGTRGWAWLSVYRDDEVLAIELRGNRPRLVALQHRDRHDLAWWIGERIT